MASIWNDLQGVEFRQTFIDAGGVRTRAIEAGSGTPLIFLHGTGGHAEAYLRNIEAHAAHFHVFAVDMVGHGYSSMPDIDYGMQHYVDHMRDLITAIGGGKAIISGESLGAQVAAWTAIQHPDLIHKIVMNTGTLLEPTDEGKKDLQDLLERSKKATGTPDRETIRGRLHWLVHEEASITDELVEARYRIYTQPGRAETIKKINGQSINGLLDPDMIAKWNNAELLKKIPVPTLVLWTRYNPGQHVPLAEQSAELIPDAELVVLENSGHWPQWEEADEFNRLHLEFLLK